MSSNNILNLFPKGRKKIIEQNLNKKEQPPVNSPTITDRRNLQNGGDRKF